MAWRTQGEDGALPCNPPRQRGTREIGERISVRATDEGDGKPWGVLAGIGGVRAVWPPLHGNTALIGLHLSPAGEKPHGRWGGAGRKRAKSPWTRGMRACVGNARDVRAGPTVGTYRASLLPDNWSGAGGPLIGDDPAGSGRWSGASCTTSFSSWRGR